MTTYTILFNYILSKINENYSIYQKNKNDHI